jgi:DNA polymerase/3'-5' exonuclease PolX
MVTLHLKKDEVARGLRDQNMSLNKMKFEVEMISYIGRIHKITSIGKRTEWK